jgi:hypothetical protein
VWSVDVYASAAFSPVVTLFVIASSVVVLLAGIVIGFARARRRDALAASAEASVGGATHPLVEGTDVVLSGIVRHLEDHDVAVKVSITQAGSESESSGSWSHSWTEIDRDIVLAPFLIELSTGELVRVAPPKNVDVADALDQKVWISRTTRVLSAELVPGEHIYARGRLERSDVASPSPAYRDVAWGWALHPAAGQMLLSSEPLGAGLRERARFHRRFAWLALALLLATQLTLVWLYGRVRGDTVTATVADTRFYRTTDSDGHTTDHHAVDLAPDHLPDRNLVDPTIEVSRGDYAFLQAGNRLPVRRASATNWNLGASATIGIVHGVVVFLTPSAFWILYLARRRSSRPWFRRKLNERGPGRLPDPG